MDSVKKKDLIINTAIVLLSVVLLISIIPIIISSIYSHPLYDDFYYSKDVYHAVINGGNVFDVFSASVNTVITTYKTWQGTYFAIFLFSMQPASFSDKLYFITTLVMVFSLIGSTTFFISSLSRLLGINKKWSLILSLITLILSINFVIDKHQAFFWWNGCSYYTLSYAISLLLFSFLIRMYHADKKTRIVLTVLSVILSVLIGGSNYSTALFSSAVLFIVSVLVFILNKKKSPVYLIVFLVLVSSLVISMIAPGNSVRASENVGISATDAIIESIFFSLIYMASWTGLSQIAGFIAVTFIGLVSTKKSKFEFKYPLIVIVLSTLLYATQLTPSLYALGYIGEGRLVNVFYYSYYLLVSFNILYLCGWINKKKQIHMKNGIQKTISLVCGLVLVVCLFFGGCIKYGFKNLTAVDTSLALINGTPQEYSKEYLDRIDQIKNGNGTISEIETIPDFFGPLSIDEDPDYWLNRGMEDYYGIDEIALYSE